MKSFIYVFHIYDMNITLRKVKYKKQCFTFTELSNWGPFPTREFFSYIFNIFSLFQAAILYSYPQSEKTLFTSALKLTTCLLLTPFFFYCFFSYFSVCSLVDFGERQKLASLSHCYLKALFSYSYPYHFLYFTFVEKTISIIVLFLKWPLQFVLKFSS